MDIVSRGFSGRRSAEGAKLPPGQYLTTDFPVLSAGPTPHVPLDRWEFTINDGNKLLRKWDWKSFRELPSETTTVDLHCVTRWSKLGTVWEGVSLDTLLADIQTDASYSMAHSYGDYTTNLPLNDLKDKKAWIAFRFDGKDLEPEHGGPARLLVPHLYLWKSAKWVGGIIRPGPYGCRKTVCPLRRKKALRRRTCILAKSRRRGTVPRLPARTPSSGKRSPARVS